MTGGVLHVEDRDPDEAHAQLCARDLTAEMTVDEDGVPAVVITDGATRVEIACGMRRPSPAAAADVRRVAWALLEYADAIDPAGTVTA